MPIHTCNNEADLTAAIAAAVYGDEIRCAENVTFTHPSTGWVFPVKSGYTGSETILVTTTASSGLPGTGERTGPAYASKLPKFRSRQTSGNQNTPCITVSPAAKGWVFRHLEIRQTFFGGGTMFRVGSSSTDQFLKSHQPENIVVDRCYFNTLPFPYWLQRRALEAHGINISIINCYTEAIGCPTGSSEAVGIWIMNGYGPYTITNNHISGGTYCILTGGAHSQIRTIATVQASPSPTSSSMKVDWSASTVPTSDPPEVGEYLSVIAGGEAHHATITSYTPSTSNSGVIEFDYDDINGSPFSTAPSAGAEVRWGAIPNNITINNNRMIKPAAWVGSKILATPQNTDAQAESGGSLIAGSYNARIHARVQGFQGVFTVSDASAAINLNVTTNQRISASWDAVSGATAYRLFIQFPDGTWRYVETASTSALFSTPTSGTASSAPGSGQRWHVKNLLELKTGIIVDIYNNIFEQCFPGSGNGFALWIKSNNQGTAFTSPFNLTKTVDIHHNIIRNTNGILSVAAREFETSDQTKRPGQLDDMKFRHNLCYDTGVEPWAEGTTTNWGLSLTGGSRITIDHNTVIHTQKAALRLIVSVANDNYITPDLVITNNLFIKNTEGVRGQSSGFQNTEGSISLDNHSLSDYSFTNNALAGGTAGSYPAGVGNLFPSVNTFQTTYFTDYAAKDFSLAAGTSPALGAGTGGSDLGCDIATVLTDTATVITGIPLAGPPPIINNSFLPDGVEDTDYSVLLTATDGTPPYVWTVEDGDLPDGLSLSAGGLLSGTPTVVGEFTFTIRVTDDTPQNADREYTVTITAAEVDVPQLWYVPSNVPASNTSLGVSAGWTTGGPASSQRYTLGLERVDSPMAAINRINSNTNPSFICVLQGVTYPLAAQEIRGTVRGVIRCAENNVNLNATVALCVRVVDKLGNEVAVLTNSGSTTPVAEDDISATVEFTAYNASPLTEGRGRIFKDSAGTTDVPLAPYTCADEDMVVVELGYRTTDTTSSRRGYLIVGDNSSTDQTHEEATSANTQNPWIEFSRSLVEYIPFIPPFHLPEQIPAPSGYAYSYRLQHYHVAPSESPQ